MRRSTPRYPQGETSADADLILVVEDDPVEHMLVARAMKRAQLNVTLRFCTGSEDLDAYLRGIDSGSERVPDLVLMDLMLPGHSGQDLITHLRLQTTVRLVPIIAYSSGWVGPEVRKAYAAGANAFVTKPLTFEDTVRFVIELDDFWLRRAVLPTPAT